MGEILVYALVAIIAHNHFLQQVIFSDKKLNSYMLISIASIS